MKYIIKNIIKEDYVNKKKNREYIDFVVNDVLDSITLTDYHPFDDGRFSTISEFVSMYGEEELDRVSSNPEFYNKYGWDEVEYEYGYYYFRMDNPEEEYDFDEFNLEFGYDVIEGGFYILKKQKLFKLDAYVFVGSHLKNTLFK